MPLDPDYLLGLPPIETIHRYTARDTILYALGVGVGRRAPCDADELQFVFEEGLKPLPTMAVVLAYPGFWAKDPKYRLDWRRILHGEQAVEIHTPLPTEGVVIGTTRIDSIVDKGADKGALIYSSRKIIEQHSGRQLATIRQVTFARGDGGFGGSSRSPSSPHEFPSHNPDLIFDVPTYADLALIYRLSGDFNPLHIDPAVARSAGFEVPILHGLATFGAVGRGLLRLDGPSRPETVRKIEARFSSPVIPGDLIEVEAWRESSSVFFFRARVPARGVVVLQNGRLELNVP